VTQIRVAPERSQTIPTPTQKAASDIEVPSFQFESRYGVFHADSDYSSGTCAYLFVINS
jgi:hypothetical protein